MTVSRREFLRAGAGVAAGLVPGMNLAAAARTPRSPTLGCMPSSRRIPRPCSSAARTSRTRWTAPPSCARASRWRGRSSCRMDQPGIPVTRRIVLKPNATGVYDRKRKPEENWGVGTDPQFYEGMVTGAEGTRPEAVLLRRIDRLRHVESARVQRHQRTLGRGHRRVGAPAEEPARRLRNELGQGAGRRGLHAHPALCPGGRARHLAAGHCQVEGAQHVPDPDGQEPAGHWWRTRSPVSAAAGGRC